MSINLWPVQCYDCGFLLGAYQEPFENLLMEGMTPLQAATHLGIARMCCRKHIVSSPIMPSRYHALLDKSEISQASVHLAGQQQVAPRTTPSGDTLRSMALTAPTAVSSTTSGNPTLTNATIQLGSRYQINTPAIGTAGGGRRVRVYIAL